MITTASLAVISSAPSALPGRRAAKGRAPTGICSLAASSSPATCTENDKPSATFGRRGLLGALAFAAAAPIPMWADAIGPESAALDVISYSTIDCEGFGLNGVRCVGVDATVNNTSKKPAYNAEVFGRVKNAKTGETALYGDFAEATDGGKIADIDTVPPGKSDVHFTLKLEPASEGAELEFVGLKTRMYPGMRQDFRIMKPVTDTLDCEEAELLGEPCDSIP